ncbi:hypothetical protein PFLUV_G00001110 [Perca fluviatilis]|uniref:Uncharacterized protein n=1 Tax=Perca fluviatilis TaxID=8168 RepID=A0A6A5FQ54_PERFL|nr:hypothetical protein PFLUV_G00001110 [Perca fluviatilis]
MDWQGRKLAKRSNQDDSESIEVKKCRNWFPFGWITGSEDPGTSQRAEDQRGARSPSVIAQDGGLVSNPQISGSAVGRDLTIINNRYASSPDRTDETKAASPKNKGIVC